MKIIIVGAGIGGLTAALCLHESGHDVVIQEQATALTEVGAGIQISPNGMQVLRALHLEDAIVEHAFYPEASQFRDGRSGRVMLTSPMAGFQRKFGAPYIHIHRADLVGALARTVEKRMSSALMLGQSVVKYGQKGNRVWTELTDGTITEADMIVGADGIRSVVRNQMLGPEKPRFTGNVAWRATVAVERLGRNIPPPNACIWLGAGKHAVTYLVRGGKLANFVGVVERANWQKESWTEKGDARAALADFAGWHPIITNLIKNAEEHYRWALFERAPLEKWHEDNVVLIGDAAHAMLPFMAQGAVQAMEDGYMLARILSRSQPISEALNSFYKIRHPHTSRVQNLARQNMQLFHQRTSAGQFARNTALRLFDKKPENQGYSALDWLYGHDVTKFF